MSGAEDSSENPSLNFDSIKQTTSNGIEFWSARDLSKLLGYTSWQHFDSATKRARIACQQVGQIVTDHFNSAVKMVKLGSGSSREVKDYLLSRFACYLIAQNGDPRKPEIAAAQAYFAASTRQNELRLLEEAEAQQQRLELRDRLEENTHLLNQAAREAGVLPRGFGQFQRAGFEGLYGGLSESEVKLRKGIDEKENLLDRASRSELVANDFRVTQTEEKLRRERIIGQNSAIETHKEVGQKVRATIKELGNAMPEDLPAEPSLKLLKRKRRNPKKQLKNEQP